ncbi:MAG: FHA domain-containing protein [Bacteroidota bacterium]
MQPVKFKVKCTHCQEPNIVSVSEEMLGKNSLRKCTHCGGMFPFMAPTKEKVAQIIESKQVPVPEPLKPEPEEDGFKTTINPNFGRREKILKLECHANEFGQMQHFEVSQPYISVGRLSYEQGSYRADIAVETTDVYMSRKHGVFKKYTNNDFTVADLGSANGTFLNDVKLHPSEEPILKDGDVVRMGKTIFTVKII